MNCQVCDYNWEARDEDIIPKACPRCKRYDWNITKEKKEKDIDI